MNDLFRPEVFQARQNAWLGSVQFSQPIPVRVVTVFVAFLIVFAVLFVGLGTYTRRVHAKGAMLPPEGLVTVTAARPGVVLTLQAHEGQHVHKGDVLFEIDLDTRSASGQTSQQILAALGEQKRLLGEQHTLRQADAPLERQGMINQMTFLAQQKVAVTEQIIQEENTLALMRRELTELEQGARDHMVTQTQVQQQLSTFAQHEASHDAAVQTRIDTEGKMADLASKLKRFDGQLAHDLNEIDQKITTTNQQIADQESHGVSLIVAPEDGTLTALRAFRGEQVTAGMPLVTLLPEAGNLLAEFYVTSAAIGFVHPGQPVYLRYAAFPYQRFGLYRGLVTEITHAPVTSTESQMQSGQEDAHKGEEAAHGTTSDVYRIRVQPDHFYVLVDGKQRPLEPGMAVEADIATDRRRLYQWIFSPLTAIHDTVVTTLNGPQP